MRILMPEGEDKKVKVELSKEAKEALSEMGLLLHGKKEFTMEECYEILEHASSKFDSHKKNSELSEDEKIWKTLHDSLFERVKSNMDPADQDNFQKSYEGKREMENLREHFERFNDLGKNIEKKFLEQVALIAFHFNKEENQYRKDEDGLASMMVDENCPPEKRVELAETILKINEKYRELVLAPVKKLEKDLKYSLGQAKSELEGMERHGEALKELKAEENTKLSHEWLELSMKHLQGREMARRTIEAMLEGDVFLPKFMIKNQGRNEALGEEATEAFKNKMIDVAKWESAGSNIEKEIGPKRKEVAQALFGNLEDAEAPAASTAPSKPRNPLEVKWWYRLAKVVYILALILAGLIALVMLQASFEAFLWVGGILGVILWGVRKAFFYIVTGK